MERHLENLVSVVIPTCLRPGLVLRAVRSVIAQTYTQLEVIVVIDGRDPLTRAALDTICDARLRVMETGGERCGPSHARNAGILAATGDWVALLDDDDEWFPQKLELQMEVAKQDSTFNGLIATRVIARTPSRDCIWPDLPMFPDQDISEYLLDRPSILGRPGFIHTSSLLAPRRLFASVPFESTPDHEDWTFIITVCKQHKLPIKVIWQPLCIYYFDPDAVSQSRRAPWQASYRWAEDIYPLLTRKAFASFMLSKVVGKARVQNDYRGLFRAFVCAVRRGKPQLRHIAIFCGMCLLPKTLLRKAVERSFGRAVRVTTQ